MSIVILAASPSAPSRSTRLGNMAARFLREEGLAADTIEIRSLPPMDLFFGNRNSLAIADALKRIDQAKAVVVTTPVYQGAYSGALKAFLDLMPVNSLQGKIVLPIATSGSIAHALALDYSLKPVLSVLGARYVLAGIHAIDAHFLASDGLIAAELEARLTDGCRRLIEALSWSAHLHGNPCPRKPAAAPFLATERCR